MAKHRWITYADKYEGGLRLIDYSAGLDDGHHFGPKCKNCGREGFCGLCQPEVEDEECPDV